MIGLLIREYFCDLPGIGGFGMAMLRRTTVPTFGMKLTRHQPAAISMFR
jgi:hypothetical protein